MSESPDKLVVPSDSVPVDGDLVLWLIKRLRAPKAPASALKQGKLWAESDVINF
jgi:hypothetical protein